MRPILFFHAMLVFTLATAAKADGLLSPPPPKKLDGPPKQIMLGPIYKERHFCSEHTAVSWNLGDSLATDCIVVSDFGHGFPKFYRTDGKKNEDWYGWHADVLAPISGKVIGTIVNDVENVPGNFGKGQASAIQILTPQNQMVILVHVTNIRVQIGDPVKMGQVVAQVGNSGIADAPHTHVGAGLFLLSFPRKRESNLCNVPPRKLDARFRGHDNLALRQPEHDQTIAHRRAVYEGAARRHHRHIL